MGGSASSLANQPMNAALQELRNQNAKTYQELNRISDAILEDE